MRRSASALVGAAVLAGGLVFGAGSALAEEPSVDGVKGEIAALVCADLDTQVADIRSDIGALVNIGLTDTDEGVLSGMLDDRITELDCDRQEPEPEPTTTTTPTEDPDPVDDGGLEDCETPLNSTQTQQLRLLIRDNTVAVGGVAQLFLFDGTGTMCEHVVTQADVDGANGGGTPTSTPSSTVVTPLEDDDSTADTSGDQVVDVPEGSVATGGA